MIFHKLVSYLEAVSLQSGVIYGRQLRVCKTSVNGQMTASMCSYSLSVSIKEWMRLLQKILCTYNPRYDWHVWSRPKFAYGISHLLDQNLEELEADFSFFSITRFYDFLFDCSHSSERSQKYLRWKHYQIIMATECLRYCLKSCILLIFCLY